MSTILQRRKLVVEQLDKYCTSSKWAEKEAYLASVVAQVNAGDHDDILYEGGQHYMASTFIIIAQEKMLNSGDSKTEKHQRREKAKQDTAASRKGAKDLENITIMNKLLLQSQGHVDEVSWFFYTNFICE